MVHVLKNDCLQISFDDRGCLESLRRMTTGKELISCPGLDFWRLVLPLGDEPEAVVHASRQNPAEFSDEDGTLKVSYPQVVDDEGRNVGACFAFTVELQDEELHFRAWIENVSAPEIRELWFPILGGLGRADADGEKSFLLYPESLGRRIFNPVRNLADRNAPPVRGDRPHYLRDFYPGRASMQWMGLYDPSGGLYLGSHDDSLQTTALNAMLNVGSRAEDDSISLGFIKYPFAGNGVRWESAPFVAAVHDGGWRSDARRYRKFADTYQDHRRDRSAWVREMPALHDIILLHQRGKVNYRYAQLPAIADTAAAGDVRAVKLTGWSEGGHDNCFPDFLPSEILGGEKRLAGGIAKMQAKGCRAVQYFHFAQMSPNSEFYRRHGEFCAIKSPSGNPFIDIFTWPGGGSITGMNERMQLINACPDTAQWHEQILDCVRRGLAWGADAIFLDQTAGAPGSFLCFDRRHGHRGPAWACGPGKTRLSLAARELVKAAGDDRALGAEYVADVILQYYDFTIPFGAGTRFGGHHFGEMYRYTFPEDIICSQYISREDYDQLHYSFVMGYRFFLTPGQQCELIDSFDSRFIGRIKLLAGLWKRNADPLLLGIFRDDEPLELPDRRLVARAYESGKCAAVALWNPTDVVLPLSIKWPGRRLERIEIADMDAAGRNAEAIGPQEVAVLGYGPP